MPTVADKYILILGGELVLSTDTCQLLSVQCAPGGTVWLASRIK